LLKHFVIRNLHSLLGFENYLFIFSIFKISTLNLYKNKTEYLHFTKLFSDDANIIIIGANTGITTVPISKNVPNGKIFAVEPVKENYDILVKVIEHYKLKNTKALNYALGSENKMIEMVMPIVDNTKSHGLCYIGEVNQEKYGKGIKFTVEMKKLDDLFSTFKESIDGIKVVAENYEKFIFEGAEELIKKNMPLIYCELWFNENRNKVLDLIRSWNYEIFVFANNALVLYDENKHPTRSLFFVPKSKREKDVKFNIK